MFDALGDRLQHALGDLRGKGRLDEEAISRAMRGIRLALLEADVNLKVVTIIGNHPESFAKAAQVAVTEAAKTIRGISGADVLSMSCEVEGDRISMYRTTVNIAFAVER